ncbi:MAG: flagellar biosynthesis protein FlhF [Peptococcaceae bacterium]|nr:flagellar biosynthesis protein FlhF [Peptococcaceae bacterium]
MRIKKVVAKDMQIALHLLRKELGPDAVIVSSRPIREPGFFGLFKQPRVEVTAAAERLPEKEISDEFLKSELLEIRALLNQISATELKSSLKGGLTAKWAERFRMAELSPDIVSRLSEHLGPGSGGKNDEETRVLEHIAKYFALPKPKGRGKRVSVFVGPTGVGKTTTIAKLAARRALLDKKRVALITIDTFRIGAVEQLKIYGDIIGVPVEVVTSPNEFRAALQRHKNRDEVFVDTTGRSAKKLVQVAELKAYFEGMPELDMYLVVSATTKSRDLLAIYRAFCDLGLYAAIITKCDETENLGGVVDLCARTSIPLAYLANGQNVPEDILVVEPRELAKLVLGVRE